MAHYHTLNGSSHPFTTPEDKPIALLVNVKDLTGSPTTTVIQQKASGEALSEFIEYVEQALGEAGLKVVHYNIVPTIEEDQFQ